MLISLWSRSVDGWYVSDAPVTDIHTMSTLSLHFASAFGSELRHQDVMACFFDGVARGLENIERYSRRKH